jgi:hypothetical protein
MSIEKGSDCSLALIWQVDFVMGADGSRFVECHSRLKVDYEDVLELFQPLDLVLTIHSPGELSVGLKSAAGFAQQGCEVEILFEPHARGLKANCPTVFQGDITRNISFRRLYSENGRVCDV